MKRGDMDAFEVLKLLCFLGAVGAFWFLFTTERDENRALKAEIVLIKAEHKKLTDATNGLVGRMDGRLSEWTNSMMVHKNEMDVMKTNCANLVTQCEALKQDQERIKKAPKPQNIKVQIESIPVGIISNPVQNKVKEAKKNAVKSGVAK